METASAPGLEALEPGWASAATQKAEMQRYAREQASRYGVEPESYVRQIQQESGFNPQAHNRVSGAKGIAQFMDPTAAEEGIDPFDWRQALEAGARYRAKQTKYLGGNDRAGTAAYNYGVGNVERLQKQYGDAWEDYLPEETKTYLSAVYGTGNAPHARPVLGNEVTSLGVETPSPVSGEEMIRRVREARAERERRMQETLTGGINPNQGGFRDPRYNPANVEPGANADIVGALGAVNDVLKPYLEPVRDAAGDLAEAGVIGVPGLQQAAQIGGAVEGLTGAPNLPGKLNRLGAEGAVPTTVLDSALTIGPGNILKAFPKVAALFRSEPQLLGMVQRASKGANGLEDSVRAIQKAMDDVLAAGGTQAEARAAAKAAMQQATKATGAADDAARASEGALQKAEGWAQYGTGPEAQAVREATERSAGTAGQLSERMGNAAVDPKKTAWTITNAAGDAKRVETELPHGYADVEAASAGGAMRRLEQNTLDQDALNAGIRGDKAAGSAARSREAIARMADDAERTITGEVAPTTPAEIAARLADEAERIAREGVGAGTADTLAELARIAKVAGDPFAEGRRQFQQDDGPGNAAVKQQAPKQPALPGMAATPAASTLWDGIVGLYSEGAGAVGGVRTLAASGDVGHIMRQGQALGWGNRKVWKDMAVASVKAYADEAYAEGATVAMKADPMYQTAVDSGLKIYEYGKNIDPAMRTPGFEGLNASRVSSALGSLPHVAGGERAMAVGLNHQGFEVFKQWANGVTDPKQLEALADVINHARGFSAAGGKVEAASKLNALFSAQYTASRFNVLADPFIELAKGNTQAAKLATQNLLSLAGANLSMLAFLGVTGEASGRWSVNANPVDGDFGQLRIGNTRIDTLAGMGPIIKTVARITAATGVAGEDAQRDVTEINRSLLKFMENKQAPVFGMIERYGVHGQTPDVKTPRFWGEMVAPMLAFDVYDAVKDNEGANKVLGIPAAIASGAGAGASTYRTTEDYKNEGAGSLYGGRKYDDLSPTERLKVLAQLPDEAGVRATTPERRDYESTRENVGYSEPEAAPEGRKETLSETKSREKVNKGINEKNKEVYAKNADVDLQRWFFANAKGGNLHSLDAVDKAIALGIPEREVKFGGYSRALNESPKVTEIYQGTREIFANYDAATKDPANLDRAAREMGFKSYAETPEDRQDDARTRITNGIQRRDPQLDAVLAFFGKSTSITPAAKQYLDKMVAHAGIDSKTDEILKKVKVN